MTVLTDSQFLEKRDCLAIRQALRIPLTLKFDINLKRLLSGLIKVRANSQTDVESSLLGFTERGKRSTYTMKKLESRERPKKRLLQY